MIPLSVTTAIPAEELVSILHQGALLRLPFLEGKLNQAAARVSDFEAKYATSLPCLKQQGLPANAGYELHEDFIEWEYWSDTRAALELTVTQVRQLLHATESKLGVS
jgi:hypothetical protein